MGDDEKKKVGMIGASIPTGGGWENLPVSERIRQTFERGVTRAELDLADAFGKGIKPGAIPDIQKRRTREIGDEFGAQFSVHAPYQVEFSSPSPFQQAEAAEILKQSIKYAKDMGAHIITVHPTSVMGGGFRDPFTGQLQTIPGHFICKNKDEFDEWCHEHGIEKKTTQYNHLKLQWDNFFRAQSTLYTQQQAAARPIFMKDYGQTLGFWNLARDHLEWKKKGYSKSEMKPIIEAKLLDVINSPGAAIEIKNEVKRKLDEFNSNPDDFIDNLERENQFRLGWIKKEKQKPDATMEDVNKLYDRISNNSWQQATICVGGRMNRNGTWTHVGSQDSQSNFRAALAQERVIDLKAEEPNVINNLKTTLEMAFKDPKVREMIKKGKIKVSLENLYGINGKTGWLNGFAYYTRPEHLKKALAAAKEAAKKYGVSEDAIGFTFDTEHAAIAHNQTPTEFLDKMKEAGIKITNAHLVGGSPATGVGVFGHKGFGSWEDEIMRKNPELLKKIQETGAPITIEPGSGGIKDVEDALETLRTGAPMEALMAADQAESLHKLGYTAVQQNPGYFQPTADMYSAMVNKGGFYSFGPSVQQPFKSTFGSFASPSLYGGGILHRDTPTNIWGASQPLLYSTKAGEEEGR